MHIFLVGQKHQLLLDHHPRHPRRRFELLLELAHLGLLPRRQLLRDDVHEERDLVGAEATLVLEPRGGLVVVVRAPAVERGLRQARCRLTR